MKLHLRANEANGKHTKFTVFMNGANCGELVMDEEEALFFHDLVLSAPRKLLTDKVYSSGKWVHEK